MDLEQIMQMNTFAVVGDTLNPEKYAYKIKEGLLEQGYTCLLYTSPSIDTRFTFISLEMAYSTRAAILFAFPRSLSMSPPE